ncbi:MAG: hypothetical protein J6K98_06420 [Clostridia bacterium]|nr:hypothetical protein [Clostridia bacterium]
MHLTKKQAIAYVLLFAALLAGLALWRRVNEPKFPGDMSLLFYEGRLYVGDPGDHGVRELPQGWTQSGAVTEEISAKKTPKENGQCTWFGAGTPIYANADEPDTVYLYAVLKYFQYDVKE